jgi:hypothetical protein
MVAKMFSWLAGLALVLVFMVIISPDLFRGYVHLWELAIGLQHARLHHRLNLTPAGDLKNAFVFSIFG